MGAVHLVGKNGVVYEQNLDDDTIGQACAIDAYDPSAGWAEVDEPSN